MHRFVAPGGPARAAFDKVPVRHFADHEIIRRHIWPLHLQMTFQAQVIIALDQKLPIYRPMRPMTRGAPFPHRFVLENKWTALLSMTLRASFIQAGHRKPSSRFHDVVPMGVMAAHAVHVPFDDRMMLRQVEFRMHIEMALKTRRRVLARVYDKTSPSAANAHMFARRSVTRFTPAHMREFDIVLVEAPVRAVWKRSRNIRVTLNAGSVADEIRSRYMRRRNHRTFERRARQQENKHSDTATNPQYVSVHLN